MSGQLAKLLEFTWFLDYHVSKQLSWFLWDKRESATWLGGFMISNEGGCNFSGKKMQISGWLVIKAKNVSHLSNWGFFFHFFFLFGGGYLMASIKSIWKDKAYNYNFKLARPSSPGLVY